MSELKDNDLKERLTDILSNYEFSGQPIQQSYIDLMAAAYNLDRDNDIYNRIEKLIDLQERSAVRYKACFGRENPNGEQIYQYFAILLRELLHPNPPQS